MIVIYLHSGKQIVARGNALGAWRRFLMMFRLPLQFKAFEDEDRYDVPAAAISQVQVIDDDVARRRRAEKEARDAKAEEAKPRMVQVPGMRIPGRR